MKQQLLMVDEIGFGEAISGFEKYEPKEIELLRELTYRNGNTTWKPNVLFCPVCTKIREKDTMTGGYKDKWVVSKEDYFFTLEYKEDEEGTLYAGCSKCNFDARSHVPEYDTYVSIILTDDNDDGPPLPIELFHDTVYQQGFFIMPSAEHERMREVGTNEYGRILPATDIDGTRYVITWGDFISKMRSFPSLSVVGIPKTYFKSL